MAPVSKKKGVSFVKADKVSVDTAKQQAASSKQKPVVVSALKKAASTTSAAAAAAAAAKKKSAKKNVSKVNRLAAVSKIAAAPAGKKNAGGSKKGKNSKKKSGKKDKKRCPPYVALQLRNLPDAFQEPQLRKFLAQFNVPVSQMFVQRTKKRATSRGLAYIRFSPKDTNQEKALDIILDEVSSMNLGGKTVSAKWVTLTRKMPTRRTTDARRQIEYLNKTEGVKLDRFDTHHFDWVARLQRAAKNETTGNKFLKSIGLNYSFSGFNDQLPLLTKQIKDTSAKAQSAVKLTRLATAIGRRKGFTNQKMLKKVLDKKRAKKKNAKKETGVAKAANTATATPSTTAPADASTKKKVAASLTSPTKRAAPAAKKATKK